MKGAFRVYRVLIADEHSGMPYLRESNLHSIRSNLFLSITCVNFKVKMPRPHIFDTGFAILLRGDAWAGVLESGLLRQEASAAFPAFQDHFLQLSSEIRMKPKEYFRALNFNF